LQQFGIRAVACCCLSRIAATLSYKSINSGLEQNMGCPFVQLPGSRQFETGFRR